jgi:hypothetical protein
VILLSDHGHVLDQGSKLIRRQDASDRWRSVVVDQPISGDELVVAGHRVLADGKHFISPAIESLRYTPNRRQGYHGGLTPQECLAPISVVAPSLTEIEGWQVQATPAPDWWLDNAGEESVTLPHITPRKGKAAARPPLPLFQDVDKQGDSVAALLASEVFVQQMEVFGGRLKREQVEQAVRALTERNGVQMKPALAQRLAVPPIRVDGILASLQRVLNVDGYPVLTIDSSQTVRLNLALLREQFALNEGAQP